MTGARGKFLLPLLLLVPLALPSTAVTPEELESFFVSSSGLALSRADAYALAKNEAGTLTRCGVTVSALKELKAVLYNSDVLDIGMSQLREKLLPLAKEHVAPERLTALYQTLYSSTSMDLPKTDAQSRSIELAQRMAEPDQLKQLYDMLYSPSSLDLPKKDAQVNAIELTAAGADAGTLKVAFQQAKRLGRSTDLALKEASAAAVSRNLDGLVRRYAKDGKPYTAAEFQTYYSEGWMAEWMAGPQEKHVADDSKAYYASEFSAHYGTSWQSKWQASSVATQMRIADDGMTYNTDQFVQYYKDSWRSKWATSPEVPCGECSPYSQADLVV